MFYSKTDLVKKLDLNLNTLNKYLASSTPKKNQIKKKSKNNLYSKDYLQAIFKQNNRLDLIELLNTNLKGLTTKDYKDIDPSLKTPKNGLYEVLENQVKDLQDQLQIKDKQIENLTRLLENQQSLLKNQQALEYSSNTDKLLRKNPLTKFLSLFRKS